MNVWTFDLSINTGVVMGAPPMDGDLSKLNSHTVSLRTRTFEKDRIDEDIAHLCENFDAYLYQALVWKPGHPDRVFFEAPLDPNWKPRDGRPRGALELLLPSNLVTTLRRRMERNGIPVEKVYPATVRAAFIDKANEGERGKTKTAVLDRCKLWGYLPERCRDDNRGDAVAMWHWAQTTKARWQPPCEIVFGKRVALVQQERAA